MTKGYIPNPDGCGDGINKRLLMKNNESTSIDGMNFGKKNKKQSSNKCTKPINGNYSSSPVNCEIQWRCSIFSGRIVYNKTTYNEENIYTNSTIV